MKHTNAKVVEEIVDPGNMQMPVLDGPFIFILRQYPHFEQASTQDLAPKSNFGIPVKRRTSYISESGLLAELMEAGLMFLGRFGFGTRPRSRNLASHPSMLSACPPSIMMVFSSALLPSTVP